MKETWLGLRAGYQHVVTGRGSPNDIAGLEPTNLDVYSAGASLYRGLGIIKAKVDYDFRYLDYGNTIIPAGVFTTSNGTRGENTVNGKISYDVTQNLKPLYSRVGQRS